MRLRFETPPKVTLSITASCNLDCIHCYSNCSREPSSRELNATELKRFIDYLAANNFIQIYIEGGEPMLRPDFDDTLRYCAKKLMTLVRTHGTLITEEKARLWRSLGVGRVLVDLMGARAETHEYLTGVPGSFTKSCEAVRHLHKAGVPTDVLIVLNRSNVGDLNEVLMLAHSLGAQRVGILRLYPLGRAKQRWEELALSLHEQEFAIKYLQIPAGLTVMQSWHPNDGNCCWQAAAVDPFGESIGCMYLREYVGYGNIRSVPLLDTWHNDPLYKKLRSGEVDHTCHGCHVNEGTRGGCRSTAYAFSGSWTAPDPFCHHLNRGIDLRVLPDWLLQAKPRPPAAPGT